MPVEWAYAFKSALSLFQIRDRLRELGHGEWQERDNDHYGDYIAGDLWGARMRIFSDGGGGSELGTYDPKGYMLIDYSRSGLDKANEAHNRRIREELFPSIEVIEWHPEDRND